MRGNSEKRDETGKEMMGKASVSQSRASVLPPPVPIQPPCYPETTESVSFGRVYLEGKVRTRSKDVKVEWVDIFSGF